MRLRADLSRIRVLALPHVRSGTAFHPTEIWATAKLDYPFGGLRLNPPVCVLALSIR